MTERPIKRIRMANRDGEPGDLALTVGERGAHASYYLRCYSDGTFDVFAVVNGELVAIAGIGTDGAVGGLCLVARLDAFLDDHPDCR